MIHGFVHFFVSLPGLLVLGFLDAAFFFTLPLGIDAVVVTLAAKRGAYFWLTPVLATAGSLAGAALTYWTGMKVGQAGLKRFCPPKWFDRVQGRLKGSAATLAALDLMPPPFPFSLFVLGAGAVKVDRKKFFTTLALCRLLRFGVEALLGLRYGGYALTWIESDTVEQWIAGVLVLAFMLSLYLLIHLRHRADRSHGTAAA
jgi:membrane protein YqaA with SNARE-associated domain